MRTIPLLLFIDDFNPVNVCHVESHESDEKFARLRLSHFRNYYKADCNAVA